MRKYKRKNVNMGIQIDEIVILHRRKSKQNQTHKLRIHCNQKLMRKLTMKDLMDCLLPYWKIYQMMCLEYWNMLHA